MIHSDQMLARTFVSPMTSTKLMAEDLSEIQQLQYEEMLPGDKRIHNEFLKNAAILIGGGQLLARYLPISNELKEALKITANCFSFSVGTIAMVCLSTDGKDWHSIYSTRRQRLAQKIQTIQNEITTGNPTNQNLHQMQLAVHHWTQIIQDYDNEIQLQKKYEQQKDYDYV